MNKYYYWNEIPMEPDRLAVYSERTGTWPEGFSVEMENLRLELIDRMNEMANEILTAKQLEVFRLMFGKERITQTEAAMRIGTVQATVSKVLHGNTIYSGRYRGRQYGGLLRKLRLASEEDPVCQRILADMERLRRQPPPDEAEDTSDST